MPVFVLNEDFYLPKIGKLNYTIWFNLLNNSC